MSRAFVKESDLEDLDQVPERTHSDLPNYITREGLAHLEQTIDQLKQTIEQLSSSDQLDAKSQLAYAQRDLRYFEERSQRAIPLDPPEQFDRVRFGHSVTLLDSGGASYKFTLVGEDEIDIDAGRISWASPIARQLTNREVGDEILWQRGEEQLNVEIVEIS